MTDGVLYHKEEKRLICCPKALNLTSYIVSGGILSVGDFAFYCCFSLAQITLPEGLASVGESAFYYCTSLSKITIPKSVTSIGSNAFSYCHRKFRLVVTEGSYAEQYAMDNGLSYEYAEA